MFALDDPRVVVSPVLILEQPFVELPGGMAGELFHEIYRTRALDVADVLLAPFDEFFGEFR